MAEAGGCSGDARTRAAARSPADSVVVMMMAPALEDVVEEEVFTSQNYTLKSGTEAGARQEDARSSPVKQLENEFLPLTIRKQVSYRKAIAKSGLQHLPSQPCSSLQAKCDSDREIRSTVDWNESALYGEHIWFETNVSGDFCYVGEQYCYAKSLQKSVARKKCAACKIVVHNICIEQLEKLSHRKSSLQGEWLDELPHKDPSFRGCGSRFPPVASRILLDTRPSWD